MRPFVKVLVALGAALVVATTSTSASADSGGKSGWEPYQTPPFDLAAGVTCSFELRGDIVYDREFTRVVERFPDGTPKVVDTVGALGVRFTNVGSGESVLRDASGALRAIFHAGGGIDFLFGGNGIAVIRTPNALYPAGAYVVSGSVVFIVHPDGSREFTNQHGTLENMCQTLA